MSEDAPTAVQAFAPSMTMFRSGRDFAAWVGLTPKQHSTGEGQRAVRRCYLSLQIKGETSIAASFVRAEATGWTAMTVSPKR